MGDSSIMVLMSLHSPHHPQGMARKDNGAWEGWNILEDNPIPPPSPGYVR